MLANIKRFILNIVLSWIFIAFSIAILDAFWLGWFAADWYQTEMQSILRQEFIQWPWLVFYLLYTSVVFVLAIVPNREKPWYYSAIDGALLGLACYGTYNLTNYSVIEGFSLKIMLIDWTWGLVLTSVSASMGWFGFQILRAEDVSNEN